MIHSASKCQDKCAPRAANWLALGRRAPGRWRRERPGEGRHLTRARYLSGEHTATAAAVQLSSGTGECTRWHKERPIGTLDSPNASDGTGIHIGAME